MKKRLIPALLTLLSSSVLAASSHTDFKSQILPIPDNVKSIMKKYTWHPGCPVPLEDLSYVELAYYGFDHKPHQGVLIVNKTVAKDVVEIFKDLYAHHFPIERMELMDVFKGDDDAAMKVNNTSSFNCRAVTGKPGVFSQHSYGRAIDINTMINPYVKGPLVLPPNGAPYVDRTKLYPGKITKNSLIYQDFISRGWSWGGDWHDLQDYQHFEKRADAEKRSPNG